MDIMAEPVLGMGMIQTISILGMIGTLVKQVLLMVLIFKGIQVANLYLKNNKNDK